MSEIQGIQFIDLNTKRHCVLIRDESHEFNGWVCFRGKDGQWVTWRKATEGDIRQVTKTEQYEFNRSALAGYWDKSSEKRTRPFNKDFTSAEKKYTDEDGEKCTLAQMCRRCPDWAARRIAESEKEKAIVDALGFIRKYEEQAIKKAPELTFHGMHPYTIALIIHDLTRGGLESDENNVA